VLFEREPAWQEVAKATGAALEVVDAVAAAAVEVVMVVRRNLGEFVAWRLAGDGDRLDLAGLFERPLIRRARLEV
jgi:hypothetical protein